MYVGGAGLARGYLNRADLTAERFLPNPFSNQPGARLYRTGDLVRSLDNKDIEYLGRIDRQVKVRGFRVELGEIEAVLGQCPGVRQVVTLLREDKPGNKRLVAYLVALNNASLNVDEVRRFARKKLPDHMVPAAFAVVESLPLMPNGKIDYRALPDPDELGLQSKAEFVSPRNELENKIAAIWKEVLGVRQVSVHDNFFDLGGHSILMAQVFEQLRQTVRENITMVEFFEHPTISALARHLSREKSAAASATAGNLPAQAEKQREGKDRLRQQFRQRQRGRRG
jgi:aryl carrier-like protein